MFAVEMDSPCGFCKLRDRIVLCPFYMGRCKYADNVQRNKKEDQKDKKSGVLAPNEEKAKGDNQ